MYKNTFRVGPKKTPQIIKFLLIFTCILSIGSALFSSLYYALPFTWTLSLSAIKQWHLWQFFSYLFIYPSTSITLSFLIRLSFTLYILWAFGTTIVDQYGTKSFTILFFLSGFIAALVALITMFLSYPIYHLGGTFVPIYALLIAWIMINPYSRLLLFFTIPIQAKWLILGLLGFNLLIDFSHGDFVRFFTLITAGLTGYFYALLAWKIKSPFLRLHTFESRMIFFAHKCSSIRHKKWFLFKKRISDEEFIDKTLQKIANKGKKSLSFREKRRLQKISKKKK